MKRNLLFSNRWIYVALIGIAFAIMTTLPFYAPRYTPILLSSILMYVILSVSWALFSGPSGYMSLATAAFFGVGVYTAAILGKTLPLPVFVIAGGVTSALVAVLVGALTLRLKGIYFAIFTFGLVMLVSQGLMFWELQVTGTRGRFVVVIDYNTVYYTMLIIFIVLMAKVYLVKRSRWGMALRSIGQNEEAASHIGINVILVKVLFYALSAFFIGAAGAAIATRWTYIDPGIAFDPNLSFLPVLMAIFGGMGKPYGPVIGAVLFAYLQEILITRLSGLYMLIFGLILVISILYLPDGITGLFTRALNKLTEKKYAHT